MTAPHEASPAAPQGALISGTVFASRYRVVRCLAAGGMGAVYEVVHIETERRRALKVMHPHLFQSDDMRERFKREARIAAQVESEYIVDVSDAGVDEATKMPFLVMELLQGEELGDRLKRIGPLPPAEVVTYLNQAGLALDKTHSKMIVHRDLKPENLFLTQREDGSPRIKILDFGVAKLVAEGATGAGATRSLGTPLYMAPEQFRTGSKLMPAADLYALGMMAYTLLAGEPYWAPEARIAGDVIAFAMTVIQGPKESAVRRAAARGVTLPATFDGWFARVTAMNPADRFPRASDAARALGEALGVLQGVGAAPLPLGSPRGSSPDLSPHHAASARGSAPEITAPQPPLTGARSGMGFAGSPSSPGTGSPPMGMGAGMVGTGSGPVGMGAGMVGTGSGPVGAAVPGYTMPMAGPPVMTGSGAQPGMLERASTSTGAAVAPPPAGQSRSRAPLIAAGALLAVGMLSVVAWLALRGTSGEPAEGPDPAAPGLSAALPLVTATETPAPVATETPSASATAEPEETPPAATSRPALTGALPAGKPAGVVPAQPKGTPPAATTKPTGKPTAKPAPAATSLIGRD